jgi:hypothetical protein
VKSKLTHRTERLPGVFRNEIYEIDDIRYTEQFDDVSGQRICGYVDMYNGVRVCSISADGILNTDFPTGWVTSRKEMLLLKEDLDRLDQFLCMICEKYKNPN